jgi:hypothetical protein
MPKNSNFQLLRIFYQFQNNSPENLKTVFVCLDFETEFSTDNAERVHRSLSDNDHVMEPEPDDIPEDVRSNSSLSTWINKERFPKFVKVTRARFSHLLSTKKLLVMAVLDENKIGQISPEMDEFRY